MNPRHPLLSAPHAATSAQYQQRQHRFQSAPVWTQNDTGAQSANSCAIIRKSLRCGLPRPTKLRGKPIIALIVLFGNRLIALLTIDTDGAAINQYLGEIGRAHV